MMRWLKRYLESDDPIVKVVGAISEQEAGMWRELLENNGIPAMSKNMSGLSVTGHVGPMAIDFDLFVKRSDLERAREILESLQEPYDGDRNGREEEHT
ncbi:MAG: DUF2007 domain-containing protein [Chloroflexi bacterium]|nr:DUF2007 domain-containing protein [Chloroflexota bacterium]